MLGNAKETVGAARKFSRISTSFLLDRLNFDKFPPLAASDTAASASAHGQNRLFARSAAVSATAAVAYAGAGGGEREKLGQGDMECEKDLFFDLMQPLDYLLATNICP